MARKRGGRNVTLVSDQNVGVDVHDEDTDIIPAGSDGLQTAAIMYGRRSFNDDRQAVQVGSGGQVATAIGANDAITDGEVATYDRIVEGGGGGRLLTVGPIAFNGTTVDRWRNNAEKTLLASALRSANTDSPSQTNYNARGIYVHLDITARTVGAGPLIRIRIYTADPVTGGQQEFARSTDFDPTVAHHAGLIYPGVAAAINGSYTQFTRLLLPIAIPRTYQLGIQFVADVTDLTYSLGVSEVL